MTAYSEQHDRTRRVMITPKISRAFWSHAKARPGDTVYLHVETRSMPAGTALTLEICWADDAELLLALDEAQIDDNRCLVEHVLDLSEAQDSRLPDADGSHRLIFMARVDDFAIEARSGPLQIPIGSFLFSS